MRISENIDSNKTCGTMKLTLCASGCVGIKFLSLHEHTFHAAGRQQHLVEGTSM